MPADQAEDDGDDEVRLARRDVHAAPARRRDDPRLLVVGDRRELRLRVQELLRELELERLARTGCCRWPAVIAISFSLDEMLGSFWMFSMRCAGCRAAGRIWLIRFSSAVGRRLEPGALVGLVRAALLDDLVGERLRGRGHLLGAPRPAHDDVDVRRGRGARARRAGGALDRDAPGELARSQARPPPRRPRWRPARARSAARTAAGRRARWSPAGRSASRAGRGRRACGPPTCAARPSPAPAGSRCPPPIGHAEGDQPPAPDEAVRVAGEVDLVARVGSRRLHGAPL